jgi:PTS system N-acetylglucosamine-specific IIC component
VVLGPQADEVAREIRAALDAEPLSTSATDRVGAFLAALGGEANISAASSASNRLRVELRDPAGVDEPAIRRLGARTLAHPAPGVTHIIFGPADAALALALQHRLAA